MKTQIETVYDRPGIGVIIIDPNAVLCSSVNQEPQKATTEEWEEITL